MNWTTCVGPQVGFDSEILSWMLIRLEQHQRLGNKSSCDILVLVVCGLFSYRCLK